MRLAVLFTPTTSSPSDFAGRAVIVIDVLRASSSIAAALANGARAVVPFAEPDEAVTFARSLDNESVLLAGERHSVAIAGFDLGNSPLEFSRARVAGKTILFTTSNGTRALLAATRETAAARDLYVGSYVNFSVVLAAARSAFRQGIDVAIVCAGSDRRFSLEDAACAGRFVRFLTDQPVNGNDVQLNDAARAALLIERRYAEDFARLFADADHGRALREAGYSADLAFCGALDTCPVVPACTDGQLVRLDTLQRR